MRRQAFTLIELMIVAIVIALLATLALVQYHQLQERALWDKARTTLLRIYAGEMAYIQENGQAKTLTTGAGPAAWQTLLIDDPESYDGGGGPILVYDITSSGVPENFLATAYYKGFIGTRQTIDEDKVFCASGGGVCNWVRP